MKNIKFAKSEEKKWTKNKKNKVFLGIFLGLIFITILMKVLVTILWDIGYYNGHTHLWYWKDKDVMEILEKSKWGSDRISGPDIKQELARRALTHPYFFWSLTQFTWQTTLIVTFVIILRFFMYDDKIPKWLSWTHSQKTLSLVTMYDVIVCIVFWSALAKTFSIDRGSSDELMNFLISASTILVHAVIPAIMVIYSLISLLFLSEASRLKRKFVFTAMIYPIIYIIFYIIMAAVWKDPYPVSNILSKESFADVWIAFLSLMGIFIGIMGMSYSHNYLLFKFNKQYRYERDYEITLEIKHKIEKYDFKIEKIEENLEEIKNPTIIKRQKLKILKYKISKEKLIASLEKQEIKVKKSHSKYVDDTNKKNNTKTIKLKTKNVKNNTKPKKKDKANKPKKKDKDTKSKKKVR
ncbi:hypothetical protein [Mycoplasma marinum]|uniref:hypothetical protein n=1 Tax=Mycoplasma marinum TaxID=1937190 RepID=UPI003B50C427